MCKCISHNQPQDGQTDKAVAVPILTAILPSGGKEYTDKEIDACIAPVIQMLQNQEIGTLSSCCGHNSATPFIVLGDGEENYSKIRRLIAEIDDRYFELSQWRRVIV